MGSRQFNVSLFLLSMIFGLSCTQSKIEYFDKAIKDADIDSTLYKSLLDSTYTFLNNVDSNTISGAAMGCLQGFFLKASDDFLVYISPNIFKEKLFINYKLQLPKDTSLVDIILFPKGKASFINVCIDFIDQSDINYKNRIFIKPISGILKYAQIPNIDTIQDLPIDVFIKLEKFKIYHINKLVEIPDTIFTFRPYMGHLG